MRKELAELDRHFAENRGWRRVGRDVYQAAQLAWFRWRIRGLAAGSPRWHRWQEKLNGGSSVGVEQRRRNEFYERTLLQCGSGLYALPGGAIYYPRNVTLGRNVMMNRGVYVVAPVPVRIGDNVLIGPYVMINSGSHHYADSQRLIRDQGHKLAPIAIEDDVWIGAHACILPGVTLGRGAVVGAGAVVTKSVPEFTIVAGVPARPIRRRGPDFAEPGR